MSFDLHHGDALEVLRGMKSDSYDACVTDPPYGIRIALISRVNSAIPEAPQT